MMKQWATIAGMFVIFLPFLAGCSTVSPDAPSAGSPVIVRIPAWVAAKANSPTPPASATKKTSIGEGMLEVKTSWKKWGQTPFPVRRVFHDPPFPPLSSVQQPGAGESDQRRGRQVSERWMKS